MAVVIAPAFLSLGYVPSSKPLGFLLDDIIVPVKVLACLHESVFLFEEKNKNNFSYAIHSTFEHD